MATTDPRMCATLVTSDLISMRGIDFDRFVTFEQQGCKMTDED